MSDLIKRSDAIEAVIEYWDGYAKPLDSWDVMNQTRAVLETLPSAEAIDLNESCEKCEHHLKGANEVPCCYCTIGKSFYTPTDAEQVTGKLKNPCDSLLKSDSDECKEHQSKLESSEAVQGWIPCSERLPLVSGEFLVTLVDNDGAWVSTAQWNMTFGGRWQDIFPNDGYRDISNVVAWKTLPIPYTKGDNDEER